MKKLLTLSFLLIYLGGHTQPATFNDVGNTKKRITASAGNGLLNSLVAAWKMEEATAANRLDSSGNGHTLVNHTTVTQETGKNGNGAGCTGASYLDSTDGGLKFDGTISFSVWISPTGITPVDNQVAICRYSTGTWAAYTTSGKLVFGAVDGMNNFQSISSTVTLTAGSFHLCTGGYDDVNHIIWVQVDHETRQSAACVGIASTSEVFTVADFSGGTGVAFVGTFDELYYWNRLITTGDETLLWNGGSGLFYDSFQN